MYFELFATDFKSAPVHFFCTGNILSSEKNLFLVLHDAFENSETINLLIDLLNQDPSGWN